MKLAIDQDRITVAGALAGVAIRTAKAVIVDLEVSVDAETVIAFTAPEPRTDCSYEAWPSFLRRNYMI